VKQSKKASQAAFTQAEITIREAFKHASAAYLANPTAETHLALLNTVKVLGAVHNPRVPDKTVRALAEMLRLAIEATVEG
jgi:hypothetical protein